MGVIDKALIQDKLSEKAIKENGPFVTRRAEVLYDELISELEVSIKVINEAIIRFNTGSSLVPTHEVLNTQTNIEIFKLNAQREAFVAAMAVDHEVIRLLKENPE